MGMHRSLTVWNRRVLDAILRSLIAVTIELPIRIAVLIVPTEAPSLVLGLARPHPGRAQPLVAAFARDLVPSPRERSSAEPGELRFRLSLVFRLRAAGARRHRLPQPRDTVALDGRGRCRGLVPNR